MNGVTMTTVSWLEAASRSGEMFLASRSKAVIRANMTPDDEPPFLGHGGRTVPTEDRSDPSAFDDDPDSLTLFDVLMGLWLPGLICLFGIVGNLLCLWVLSRHHVTIQGCSTFTSLRALAISDVVVLVGAILQQIIPMLCEFLRRRDVFCMRYAGYIRVYSWPVVCIGQMASIWTTVLVSAERYVAICASSMLPPSYSRRNWRILVFISAIWIVSVLFNVPRFFEFVTGEKFMEDSETVKVVLNVTSIRTDPVYRYFYNTFLFCVVVYAIPLSILTCLNLRLVRTIQEAKSSWTKLNRNQKMEVKTTKLPLLIVLVFFVCETESFVAFLLDAVFVNDDHPWLQVYTAVVNVLVVSNSAVNFLLMFFAGGRFRKMLLSSLQCGEKRPLVNHSWANSTRVARTGNAIHISDSRRSENLSQARFPTRSNVNKDNRGQRSGVQNPSEDAVAEFRPTRGIVVFHKKERKAKVEFPKE